ncbi:hypothetical protein CTEN210_10108 [Chaetoceros tenuissimus]|uniref:F-box domain-containing protein n=1 Tax=Chaetoceros tenuissimus TaxID=426638 RepID=A0AAD3CX33_9STRA|nr:hypothetical protein CTEN210_10108 [Chaetoceros tenuissimus]
MSTITDNQDVLHNIFSYLDTFQRNHIKRTCKSWYNISLIDCGYFLFQDTNVYNSNGKDYMDHLPHVLIVHGTEERTEDLKKIRYSDHTSRYIPKRAKGHLAEPQIFLTNKSLPLLYQSIHFERSHGGVPKLQLSEEIVKKIDPKQNHIQHSESSMAKDVISGNSKKRIQTAIISQFQNIIYEKNIMQKIYVTNLDLSNSKWGYYINGSLLKGKNSLQVLDLSCLNLLERLSVKGCSKLRTLRVPSSLQALDASACTSLFEIDMRNQNHFEDLKQCNSTNDSYSRLQSLNLNGCRSLTKAKCISDGCLRYVKELDLTSVNKLSKSILEMGLKKAFHLESVSIRYIATDNLINAIASTLHTNNRSQDNQNISLKLIDLSFSLVSDQSVKLLVNTCKFLERCNLRGCRNASAECYNQTPIFLKQRLDSGNTDLVYSLGNENSDGRKRRKGDNIFFHITTSKQVN